MNLINLNKRFNTERKCIKYLEETRFKDGIYCLHCRSNKVYKRKNDNQSLMKFHERRAEMLSKTIDIRNELIKKQEKTIMENNIMNTPPPNYTEFKNTKIKKIPMVDLKVAISEDASLIFSMIISKLDTLEKNIDLIIDHINNEDKYAKM